jgi:hypothetical protein
MLFSMPTNIFLMPWDHLYCLLPDSLILLKPWMIGGVGVSPSLHEGLGDENDNNVGVYNYFLKEKSVVLILCD